MLLQTAAGVSELLNTGAGLMVTVTVKTAPVQAPDNGITLYVAVIAAGVVLVRLPLILV